MFASSTGPRSALRRRGIVLVLVLGMLGLMALIGVTFATFAGQSLKNGRNFAQGVGRPQPEALMDYALAQLINDTNNPLSAIRGHSLLRDMYGNDSVYRGSNPTQNAVADLLNNGVFDRVYYGGSYTTLQLLGNPQIHSTSTATPFYGQLQYATNIPTTGQYSGLDFTRWILRFAPVNGVPQTFEVLEDDATTGQAHIFTLSANLGTPVADPLNNVTPLSSADVRSFIYANPNIGAAGSTGSFTKGYSTLTREGTPNGGLPFVLDGRYMRAFNGPGLTRPVQAVQDSNNNFVNYPYNQAANANMRVIGYDPDTIGMDEDYDACDLENWFLAIQSADGQVMIPSFHRPGILTALDWAAGALPVQRAKILRPRQIDNSPLFPADPDTFDTNGKLIYDIDNDGDGVTDSVWLDLGYPVQRDPNGKLYKPLFAFMVLGLNGRMPLNTVGNLQARAIGDTTNNTNDTVMYTASSGQVPYAGSYTTAGTYHLPLYSSQVFFDTPLYDHASHLGYSVNEINPKFALQNAPSNLYASLFNPNLGKTAYAIPTDYTNPVSFSQVDDAGVPVALTQLRNILAGTVPTPLSNPYTGALPINTANLSLTNYDVNIVYVNGQPYVLPNSMADNSDVLQNGQVARLATAVAGRWGEPEGIPRVLNAPLAYNDADPTYTMLRYTNPVRAGKSYYVGTAYTNDAMDDDFDAFDPFIPQQVETAQFTVVKDSTASMGPDYLPANSTNQNFLQSQFYRTYPEDVDRFDGAGQAAIAVERIRRFVTPHDPAGVGRMVAFMNRPAGDYDYGNGADKLGRIGFFRYFRPPGMPQEIVYPYTDPGLVGFNAPYATTGAAANASGLGQQYLAPVLIPAGRSKGTLTINGNTVSSVSIPDVKNNFLHGYQAMATPDTQGTNAGDPTAPLVATMGAMPYDWDAGYNSYAGGYPAGYQNTISLFSPTINPNYATILRSNVNSETGPNLGSTALNGPYYIPYVPSGQQNLPEFLPAGSYDTTTFMPSMPMVVNGYIGGSLNKDEADEMNLYTTSSQDMPYGPSDLEWLYRKHDVDGATLNSRLATLAPVSFLNPADGLTRRRLFSTDAWDTNRFAYANDNPVQYAGVMGFSGPFSGLHSPNHDFSYNSRFGPDASPSFENMNQVAFQPNSTLPRTDFANATTTEFLFNPTLPVHTYYGSNTAGNGDSFTSYVPNSSHIGSPMTLPQTLTTASFANAIVNTYSRLVIPSGTTSAMQVQTPTMAHRDRKINLNMPLPLSSDPAEPIRQKWCRETYQLLKAILPPAAVDTPEELAQLSQYVVNIIDFRDPDPASTRFVNTDLVVTDVLTKTSAPTPPATGYTAAEVANLTVLNVSPMGVRFTNGSAGDVIPPGNFPYDPSLYNPDVATPFLVQHGMEFNPIAINEAFAVQYQYPTAKGDDQLRGTCRGVFFELTNTLTESQNDSVDGNNNPSANNSSAIDLTGWDLIITPDDYGWGRPDPITGEVSVFALPPQVSGATLTDPATQGQKSANTTLPTNTPTLLQYRFTSKNDNNLYSNNKIRAINGSKVGDYGIIGAYTTSAAMVTTGAGQTNPPALATTSSGYVETNPVVFGSTVPNPANTAVLNQGVTPTPPKLDVVLPQAFIPYATPVTAGSSKGAYFWVYLRRPANPFDTADLGGNQINREMVVVDSMRFPYMDLGNAKITPSAALGTDTVGTQAPDTAFSAQRLQPYRGGHLVPKATTAITPATVGGTNVTTICPPTPAYAYGYSEQTAPSNDDRDYTQYVTSKGVVQRLSNHTLRETIGADNATIDTNRSLFPFHDRDFTSVAELLLVPGCPPGLFTKQFVEEPYPGNAVKPAVAAGWDSTTLTGVTTPPKDREVGRKDFGYTTLPAVPTFPYLTDNFYYTAASVNPPATPDAGQTHLTTEVGGWTGAGWHKMMEFFEVPSSANGAIGTADVGNNYDWYRSDLRPGQLNLNLIIDPEVFAGLVDDPRLNENIAFGSNLTTIPYVVSQIDYNGNPVRTYPMFGSQSVNIINNNPITAPYGRGYVTRDPNLADYPAGPPFIPQQVHGMNAAFSDFVKLRHGGSGLIFGHGAGDVGMGDAGFLNGAILSGSVFPTQPIAADRPFRSLSYPDINYTIMRPASLPPAPIDPNNTPPTYLGTFPSLPVTLNDFTLFNYLATTTAPFVSLQPATFAPTAAAPYIQDPGLRNPFLDVQYNTGTTAPPYDVSGYNTNPPLVTNGTVSPAPFPPTIPPTPTRRLFEIPDVTGSVYPSSNAGLDGQTDSALPGGIYQVNQPTRPRELSTGTPAVSSTVYANPISPPSLVPVTRAILAADNYTPQAENAANNYLGAGPTGTSTTDLRQHPVYRTEWLQKISNLTTVRTHQFATWITVGFFEVVKTGTPELGIPDVLGQELASGAGAKTRYRSFFVLDRTKATGFNPYYPGNFRDCVAYRRRIE